MAWHVGVLTSLDKQTYLACAAPTSVVGLDQLIYPVVMILLPLPSLPNLCSMHTRWTTISRPTHVSGGEMAHAHRGCPWCELHLSGEREWPRYRLYMYILCFTGRSRYMYLQYSYDVRGYHALTIVSHVRVHVDVHRYLLCMLTIYTVAYGMTQIRRGQWPLFMCMYT